RNFLSAERDEAVATGDSMGYDKRDSNPDGNQWGFPSADRDLTRPSLTSARANWARRIAARILVGTASSRSRATPRLGIDLHHDRQDHLPLSHPGEAWWRRHGSSV